MRAASFGGVAFASGPVSETSDVWVKGRRIFLLILWGFLMKIVGEVVHEMLGHGFYVLLFGGTIRRIDISLLWPLKTSYIWWSTPGLGAAQEALVVGGGIVNGLILSFALQAFLLLRPRPWRYAVPLIWLAFWAYLSSTGYLIAGALGSFGDVGRLIGIGVLTLASSFTLGLALFTADFASISIILRRALLMFVSEKALGRWIAAFWLSVPLAVTAAAFNPQLHTPPMLIFIGFLPAAVSLLVERLRKMSRESASAQ